MSATRQQPQTQPHQQPQTQQQQQQCAIDGKLIARIVPKEYVDFERFKPKGQKLQDEEQVDLWRQRVVWPHKQQPQQQQQPFGTSKQQRGNSSFMDLEKQIVVLDIQLKTTIFDRETETSFYPISAALALQRDPAETAQRTLRRIEISTQRRLEGRKSKSQRSISSSHSLNGELNSAIYVLLDPKSETTCAVTTPLEEDDEEEDDLDGYRKLQIVEGMENKDLWLSLMHGPKSRLWMDVISEAGITLDLDPCPPTLLSVHNFEDFTANVFVGVPLVIETQVLHADKAVVVWFAGDKQVCFDSPSYTPTQNDVGKKITALISPIRQDRPSGFEEVYQFQNPVSDRPYLPILDQRASWLAAPVVGGVDRSNGRLRVLSYNLMADIHLSPEVERRAIYADCDVAFLARTRRMPLLLYEILQHDADIICLQEVDATMYEQLLSPALVAHGFAGFYSNKATSQLEGTSSSSSSSTEKIPNNTMKQYKTVLTSVLSTIGCAMFWSLRTFEDKVETEVYPIRDLFKEAPIFDGDWDSMKRIRDFLQRMPALRIVVEENVGQILQVARLRLKSGRFASNYCFERQTALVVGNTHLFYHPLADHVRLMQAFVVCKKLDDWCRAEQGDALPQNQLIFCGDLNSCPRSGTFQLLRNRRVTPDQCETWKNVDEYTWESGDSYFDTENDEAEKEIDPALDDAQAPLKCYIPLSVEPPTIAFPDSFPQLVSGYDPIPKFTNYVVGFTETLDYIFITYSKDEHGFKVRSSAPIPTIAEPAIPNEYYPSDHVSLACDFQWT